jgi:hypothetical protein
MPRRYNNLKNVLISVSYPPLYQLLYECCPMSCRKMNMTVCFKPLSVFMTPELKIACEVVFQEHKVGSLPVKWNRDAFRGRISIGLSEMAKVTLVTKKIIFLPDRSKKVITLLNPAVAEAASFEEADEMIKNKVQVPVTGINDDQPVFIADQVSGFTNVPAKYSHSRLSIAAIPQAPLAGIKWYMKPVFYYVVWPVCAAAAGALISFLIQLTWSELFLNLK